LILAYSIETIEKHGLSMMGLYHLSTTKSKNESLRQVGFYYYYFKGEFLIFIC